MPTPTGNVRRNLLAVSLRENTIFTLAAAGLLVAACAPAPSPSLTPSTGDVAALESRLARSESDRETMVRLGAAYRNAKRNDEALALLERARTQHPNDATTVLLLGLTYEDVGRYADAQKLYEQYIRVGRSRETQAELRRRLPLVERLALQASVRAALAREAELANTAPQPRTVAVFPFLYTGENETLRPLSRALAEMLVTDLSQTNRLTVLERLQMQMLLDEMKIAESGMVDPGTATRSGRLLGAERIVQGSISGSDEALQLQAAVVRVGNPESGAAPANTPALTERDALNRLFDLEKRLALRIYNAMGIQLTPAEWQLVSKRPTQNIQALLAYGLGLEAADVGRFAQAAQHFRQAVKLDPGFAVARERAERAEAAAAAERTTTQQLARQAVAEMVPALPTLAIEAIIPTVGRRDAASETLGTEGISTTSRTVLEIIIRRP
jgi:tetratricopeptide (TPR) repeat protein